MITDITDPTILNNPHDLLREFPPVAEAVDALVSLIQVNPSPALVTAVVELAIAMGIAAAEQGLCRWRDAHALAALPFPLRTVRGSVEPRWWPER